MEKPNAELEFSTLNEKDRVYNKAVNTNYGRFYTYCEYVKNNKGIYFKLYLQDDLSKRWSQFIPFKKAKDIYVFDQKLHDSFYEDKLDEKYYFDYLDLKLLVDTNYKKQTVLINLQGKILALSSNNEIETDWFKNDTCKCFQADQWAWLRANYEWNYFNMDFNQKNRINKGDKIYVTPDSTVRISAIIDGDFHDDKIVVKMIKNGEIINESFISPNHWDYIYDTIKKKAVQNVFKYNSWDRSEISLDYDYTSDSMYNKVQFYVSYEPY